MSFLSYPPGFFSKGNSLAELGARQFSLSNQLVDSGDALSSHPSHWHQRWATVPASFLKCDCWNLNSHPHACAARDLPIDPSPQPNQGWPPTHDSPAPFGHALMIYSITSNYIVSFCSLRHDLRLGWTSWCSYLSFLSAGGVHYHTQHALGFLDRQGYHCNCVYVCVNSILHIKTLKLIHIQCVLYSKQDTCNIL